MSFVFKMPVGDVLVNRLRSVKLRVGEPMKELTFAIDGATKLRFHSAQTDDSLYDHRH